MLIAGWCLAAFFLCGSMYWNCKYRDAMRAWREDLERHEKWAANTHEMLATKTGTFLTGWEDEEERSLDELVAESPKRSGGPALFPADRPSVLSGPTESGPDAG